MDCPLMFAVMQAIAGAALASYLFDDPTYPILPYMCSVVAVVGTYNVHKITQKASREAQTLRRSEMDSVDRNRVIHGSAWHLATGTFTYFTNVYVFSEGLAHNDKIWIPALAIAASGYYFAVSFVNNLEMKYNRNIFLICCQRMFEPALIASATSFLLFLWNHEEGCTFWAPLVFITATGLKIAKQGFYGAENAMKPRLLLLTAVEMWTGGCLISIGGFVMTIYASVNDFNVFFIALEAITSFIGVSVVFGSSQHFRDLELHSDLDQDTFFVLFNMIDAPITFLVSCLMLKYAQDNIIMYTICMFLAGYECIHVFKSFLKLYALVRKPDFYRYCQLLLGPVLIVYSALATACVGYSMGWRFSLATMTFIPIGMYATYRGFIRMDEYQ